jgi:hypothetical protein
MIHATSRRAMLSVANKLGVNVETRLETGDVNELTLDFLKREVHGADAAEEKKTFARPRGPPKRNQKQA